MADSSKNRISAAPLISRGLPAFSGSSANASPANDGDYSTFWESSVPDFIAYDLSEVPPALRQNVIAVWYNKSTYFPIGSYLARDMIPLDYMIETNSAPGGQCPQSGWKTAVTINDNPYSSRQHILDLSGYNWIRLNILTVSGQTNGRVSLVFDVHSITGSTPDSWLFLGDSITACGMNNCYGTGLASFVNRVDKRFFTIQENGGIGGTTSADGRKYIGRWLADSPASFVSIAYGTNDIWGKLISPGQYHSNLRFMIESVLAHGKSPVLPKIPFAADPAVGRRLPAYNAVIDALWDEFSDKLIKGPDFEAYFRDHTSQLSDSVHPTPEGYEAMRRIWAETMYERVYRQNMGKD